VNESIWTWVSGTSTLSSPAVYGEKGVADINNLPGPLHNPFAWFDESQQELSLFGGMFFIDYDGTTCAFVLFTIN